jgi:CHASE2 domain-containing sensor protein
MVVETVKTGLRDLFAALLDTIEAFNDYFILRKHVTLSETTMFMFSLGWTLWFVFVGVYVSELALSRAVWATLFAMSTVAHFCSFFFKDIIGRAFVASTYAVLWCFLTLLSAYTGSIAPAVPTLAVFTFLSVFVAVRLFRERQNRE